MDNSSQDIAERVKQRINNFKRSSVTEGKPCEVVMPAARSDVALGDTIKHSSTWAALAGAAVGAMLSYGPQLLAFIPGPIGIGARIGMFLFNVADAGTAYMMNIASVSINGSDKNRILLNVLIG